MADPLTIRKTIDLVESGVLRIPGFQRRFVWTPDKAAQLMDSLYKGYPIGSLLLWRTNKDGKLKRERDIGPFELPENEPDFPIDYVLDGQQRVTSVYCAFQTIHPLGDVDPEIWLPIYYDFEGVGEAQESQFVALAPAEAEAGEGRYFPLATFFDATAFFAAAQALEEGRRLEIVAVQEAFKEVSLPVITYESDDRANVAIVFERVNRLGVDLDIFQLLTAWTWSDEFDLEARFEDVVAELGGFGFGDAGEDHDLMLRCCGAVLLGDPRTSRLVEITGGALRDEFDNIVECIKKAVDFLRREAGVRNINLLPYRSMLVPLVAFFSAGTTPPTAEMNDVLRRWFWRCCFAHRYSGNPLRNIKADVEEATKLRRGEPSELDNFGAPVTAAFFRNHQFSIKTVAAKTLALLLAKQGPKSFISGDVVDLDEVLAGANRREFHHVYPRNYLVGQGVDQKRINQLSNIAVITRQDNNKIRDKAPSEYRALMPAEVEPIVQAALCPDSMFDDDFDSFIDERSEALAQVANSLMGLVPAATTT